MSIDYELQDGVSETAVLEVWPKDTLADTDRRLLSTLADTLDAALEDAIDAEVEDNVHRCAFSCRPQAELASDGLSSHCAGHRRDLEPISGKNARWCACVCTALVNQLFENGSAACVVRRCRYRSSG